MRDIIRSVLSLVGPLFALLLLGFTGYQTWTLLLAVSGSPIIATIGLILFEAGMIYWWFVFRTEAEGLPQMALSLMVFLACFVFVGIATALKLGAVDAAVLGEHTPAKIITAAAVIQLAAKLFFPLLHPDVTHAIKERVQDGKIMNLGNNKFDARIDGIADEYADAMVAVRTEQFLNRLNMKYSTRYLLPGMSAAVIEGQTAAPAVAPAPRRSFMDRLLNRESTPAQPAAGAADDITPAMPAPGQLSETDIMAIAAAVAAMSNSTHDAPRHDPAVIPLAAEPGQGERPNGPPAPRYGSGPNF